MKEIDELIREYKEWGNKPIYGKIIQDLEQLKEQLKEQHKEELLKLYNATQRTDFWCLYDGFEDYLNKTHEKK